MAVPEAVLKEVPREVLEEALGLFENKPVPSRKDIADRNESIKALWEAQKKIKGIKKRFADSLVDACMKTIKPIKEDNKIIDIIDSCTEALNKL